MEIGKCFGDGEVNVPDEAFGDEGLPFKMAF